MTSQIKILYVHHGCGIGGASVSLAYLLSSLDRERFKPSVLCLCDGDHIELFQNCSVKVYIDQRIKNFSFTTGAQLSIKKPLVLFSSLCQYIPSIIRYNYWFRRIKPDIVHLNSSSLSAAAIAAKRLNIKVVWHIREYILDGLFKTGRRFHRFIGNHFADSIIAVSNYDGERLGCMHKTDLIYNYVDFTKFDRHLIDNKIRESPEFKVCMLGGVSPIKGTLEFIKSFTLVKNRVKNVKYYIAGSVGIDTIPISAKTKIKRKILVLFRKKDYLQKIREVLKTLPGDSIIFTGIISHIPEFLAKMDLIVFPSTKPHFPRPVIEAWAMAKPVIASDFGEIREIITHGVDGLLVPPGDPKELSQIILNVLSNKRLAHSLGEAGYLKAKKLFNAEINTKKILEIYNNLYEV